MQHCAKNQVHSFYSFCRPLLEFGGDLEKFRQEIYYILPILYSEIQKNLNISKSGIGPRVNPICFIKLTV